MGTSCLPGPKSRYIGLLTQEVLFLESRARYLLACSGSPGCHVRVEEQSKAAPWGTGTRQVAEEQANILSYPASCPAIRGKTGDGRGHTGITHFYIHTRLGSQGNASQVQGEENTANGSCSIMLNTGEIHGKFPTTQTHCLLFIQCLAWNEKSESMQRPALQSTFRPQNVLQPYFPRLWRLGYCLN